MKPNRFVLFLILATGLAGCSDSKVETERLTTLKPILFDGSNSKSLITQKADTLMVGASCDKTTTDIKIATSTSGPYQSISSVGGNQGSLVESCRKNGTLSLDVLKLSTLQFIPGRRETKDVFFKAISGKTESTVTSLNLNYEPPIVLSAGPGQDVSIAAGKVSTGNLKMTYKIGSGMISNFNGSTFKVKPSSQ